MEAIFVSDGNEIPYTPAADVAAGDVVFIGSQPCVAKVAIKASTLGAVSKKGIYEMDKTASLVIAVGDAVYFNTSTNKVTKTNTDSALGIAVEASAATATTVKVLLK